MKENHPQEEIVQNKAWCMTPTAQLRRVLGTQNVKSLLSHKARQLCVENSVRKRMGSLSILYI